MPEPKPYQPPDFTLERKREQKSETRFQQIAKVAVGQQKALRRKLEEMKRDLTLRMDKLEADHQEEVARVKEESFQAGRQSGLEENREAVEAAIKSLEEFTELLKESEKSFIRNAEMQVVKLSLAVARKIIDREVQSDREIVVYTVREALKRVADKTEVTVRVNPDELENILSHRRELEDVDRDLGEVKFLPDEKIALGGCIVETKVGAVDGRIEAQIEEIERNFESR